MNIKACGAAALILALSCTASPVFAMPGAGDGMNAHPSDPTERFRQMDTNQDGKLTWEELSAARPNLSRNAFDIIDTGRDGTICPDEWKAFSAGHGGSAASMPDMSKMMQGMRGAGDNGMSAPAGGMPLVMPPVQNNGGTSPAPAMPGMPLITPPAEGK